jgi:hypothetical protein
VARGFPGGEGEALDVPGQKQAGASGPDAPWWLAVDRDVGMSGVNGISSTSRWCRGPSRPPGE